MRTRMEQVWLETAYYSGLESIQIILISKQARRQGVYIIYIYFDMTLRTEIPKILNFLLLEKSNLFIYRVNFKTPKTS